MKLKIALTLIISSLSFSAAAEDLPVSRSAGKQVNDDSIVLTEVLKSRPLVSIKDFGSTAEMPITREKTASGAANRVDQLFSIYEADVRLVADIDGDGFHHALRVIFDVDVDYDGASLYAKLYLSREGRSWVQYHTTDLFSIFENDSGDAYEVTTELVEGYPTGYYAVLVEIYSLNHADMVTSGILDHHNLGRDIKLEDLHRDEVEVYEEVDVYYEEYGAGSLLPSFWLLLIPMVILVRAVYRLYRRKTKIAVSTAMPH